MRGLTGIALALWMLGAPMVEAGCRLALVLAMDVSASVDAGEFALQQRGTALALLSPSVQGALLGDPGAPVAIAVFLWSGVDDQEVIAGWTVIDGAATLEAFAARIAAHPRGAARSGRTATGSALMHAERLMRSAPPCERQVVDLATDGTFNAGIAPEAVRAQPAFADITVNALAIAGGQVPDWRDDGTVETALAAYLERFVIHGPGAFVEDAQGYDDFERAMTRKLERELAGMMLGGLR